jgi:hypothetical protein
VNLLEKLDARFNAGAHTRTYNRDHDLEFVKDPATYIWFHNCNVELAAWLQELGCDCRGSGWYADFVIEQRPVGGTVSSIVGAKAEVRSSL